MLSKSLEKWNDAARINLIIRPKSPKRTDLGGLLDVMEEHGWHLEPEDLDKPLKLSNFTVLICDAEQLISNSGLTMRSN